MAGPSCPLPDVEVALAPYIRTRQEALRIRQQLVTYLQSKVTGPEEGTHHVQLAYPATLLQAKEIPAEASDLRKQYLEALDTYNASIRRRDALQAQLVESQMEHAESERKRGATDTAIESAVTYLTLQRQRQVFQKLQVIQNALQQLTESSPDLVRLDLKGLLQENLGDGPIAPSPTPEAAAADPHVEKLTLQLKKELIIAKDAVDHSTKQKNPTAPNGTSITSLQAEIHALERSRDWLITWIEGELAKISGDSEVADDSRAEEQQDDDQRPSASSYHKRIQSLYNGYVECRETYVTIVDAASAQISTALGGTTQKASSGPSPSEISPEAIISASKILPYIPLFTQGSQEEKELLQHTTHLRRQLATAANETASSLKRLADESHIVTARSDSTRAWSSVAREATTRTEEAVDNHLTDGEKSAALARAILDEHVARSNNFQLLKGTI
jgi:hypothetical protein